MPAERDPFNRASLGYRLKLLLGIGSLVYLLDWITKLVVRRTMEPYGETIPVIDNLVKLRFIYNEGIAFGLSLGSSRWLLLTLTVCVALFLLWYILASDYSDRPGLAALCLIAGGAFGNLHDRIAAGRVVDFIEIGWRDYTWPVFNVADMAVTVGAVILTLRFLRESRQPAPDEEQSPSN